jgi:hypothetical protein
MSLDVAEYLASRSDVYPLIHDVYEAKWGSLVLCGRSGQDENLYPPQEF